MASDVQAALNAEEECNADLFLDEIESLRCMTCAISDDDLESRRCPFKTGPHAT